MLQRGAVRVGEIQFVQDIDISPQVAAGITERQGWGEKTEREALFFKKANSCFLCFVPRVNGRCLRKQWSILSHWETDQPVLREREDAPPWLSADPSAAQESPAWNALGLISFTDFRMKKSALHLIYSLLCKWKPSFQFYRLKLNQ